MIKPPLQGSPDLIDSKFRVSIQNFIDAGYRVARNGSDLLAYASRVVKGCNTRMAQYAHRERCGRYPLAGSSWSRRSTGRWQRRLPSGWLADAAASAPAARQAARESRRQPAQLRHGPGLVGIGRCQCYTCNYRGRAPGEIMFGRGIPMFGTPMILSGLTCSDECASDRPGIPRGNGLQRSVFVALQKPVGELRL